MSEAALKEDALEFEMYCSWVEVAVFLNLQWVVLRVVDFVDPEKDRMRQ